jgi:hypothetical protein
MSRALRGIATGSLRLSSSGSRYVPGRSQGAYAGKPGHRRQHRPPWPDRWLAPDLGEITGAALEHHRGTSLATALEVELATAANRDTPREVAVRRGGGACRRACRAWLGLLGLGGCGPRGSGRAVPVERHADPGALEPLAAFGPRDRGAFGTWRSRETRSGGDRFADRERGDADRGERRGPTRNRLRRPATSELSASSR